MICLAEFLKRENRVVYAFVSNSVLLAVEKKQLEILTEE